MIKVAVISDIHGNIEALNAVLDDIDKNNIKKIFILGDLAFMGAEPNKTIEVIKNLDKKYDIDIIQGNTDKFIADDNLPELPDFAISALTYAKSNISQENITYLKSLPPQKSLIVGKTSVLLTHGSPRANNENILPGKNIEEIKSAIAGAKENLILCGHTHLPAGYQIEKQTIVNVGSVGRPFTGNQKACYVVLEIDKEKESVFSVEHKFIDFDIQTASKKLAALPFQGAEYLAELLLKSVAY